MVLLKTKRDASQALPKCIEYFKKQTGHVRSSAHTDGGEEVCERTIVFRDTRGGSYHKKPHSPESNRHAKRAHFALLGMARAVLLQVKLLFCY